MHGHFLRSKSKEDILEESGDDHSEKMAQPVQMTSAQLQELLSGMMAAATASAGSTTPAPITQTIGNFSTCSSRFAADKDEDVEAFINAVNIFKECVGVSDENALKGLPMLLDRFAATWWQGTKSTISDWNGALTALRHAFGVNKPAYKIFKEIFSKEQGSKEPTDVFVGNVRALLSHLPATPVLHEIHQIDMVYANLSKKIRRHIPRDQIKTFDDLITKSRSIEDGFQDEKPLPDRSEKPAINRTSKRCSFCQNFGHLQTECRKYAASQRTAGPSTQELPVPFVIKREVTCYGCGKAGYIKANCPVCRETHPSRTHPPRSTVPTSNAPSHASVELLSTSIGGGDQRPLLQVSVAGLEGLAFVDTGAACSIVGRRLYQHLVDREVPYEKGELKLTFADGKPRNVKVKTYDCTITLLTKQANLKFVAIPEYENMRTLLGIDFLQAFDLILDIARFRWKFHDTDKWTPFTSRIVDTPMSVNLAQEEQAEFPRLREDEAHDLDAVEKQQLAKLLQSYHDIFEESKEATIFAEHSIQLTDQTPIFMPPYRMSPEKTKILQSEIETMLASGVIEECESPYAAPVVLVQKKDGSWRTCIDYRRLNAVTVPDRYPLPRLDDLLHSAKQSVYMSTLDLKAGYHQVSVKPEDRDKTAFITPFGIYRFTRLPFGLRNAPATFQRLIDRFRSGLQETTIYGYLDDLIVLSSSYEEHLKDLEKVFERLRMFKLHANRKKCVFARAEVKYLGHVITREGIRTDPEKVEAILNRPPPKDVKGVMSFLQTCNWFRRFIPDFAQISKPLSDLTRKNVPFKWSTSEQEAFQKLKNLLSTAPILKQADATLPFVLKVDASSYAMGACLLQGEKEDERPVEYISKLFNRSQRNYSTTDREATALVYAVNKFRGYIEGATVFVETDHQPLKWLMSLRSPTGRLARYALQLQPFDLRIDYIPGKSNIVADMLSRPPIEEPNPPSEAQVSLIHLAMPTVSASELRSKQLEDPEVAKIIVCFEKPAPDQIDFSRWTDRGYVMQGGILYRLSPDADAEEPQLVIPRSMVPEVLKEYHDSPLSGHNGIDKTFQRIQQRFFWTTMRKDVDDHVSSLKRFVGDPGMVPNPNRPIRRRGRPRKIANSGVPVIAPRTLRPRCKGGGCNADATPLLTQSR